MESPSTRSIWWKGALKSGLKESIRGIAVGFVAAALLFGVAQFIGVAAGLGAMLAPMVGASSFSPLLLMSFCGVISGVTGLFTGGSQAVAAAQQQHLNVANVEMIRELDGRTRALEEFIAPSSGVKKIIAAGPRTQASYRDAEEQRAAQPAPESPTIH